jgi:hypothetical protein
MEKNRQWFGYDWFKLAVAVVLLLLLLILQFQAGTPVPAVETILPKYPSASFTWSYDAAAHSLLNPQGVSLFTLSPDGLSWQPAIPTDIRAQLPGGYTLFQNTTGEWVLRDAAGESLYLWDPVRFSWSPVVPGAGASAVNLTETPQPPSPAPAIKPTAEQPAGAPKIESTPAATAGVAPTAALPTEAVVTPVTPAAGGASGECIAPAQTRLVIGKSARVMMNLNLRDSPGIGTSTLRTNSTGTILEVLQGPTCIPYKNSAYQWWQVKSPDGVTGWSAEATLNGSAYFLEPVP